MQLSDVVEEGAGMHWAHACNSESRTQATLRLPEASCNPGVPNSTSISGFSILQKISITIPSLFNSSNEIDMSDENVLQAISPVRCYKPLSNPKHH